jgi:predicted GNAT family N-acyltransferase
LKKSIENKQLVWDKGVAIQFKTYQRRQTKGTFKIQVGDVHLQKIASQRNGKTKDVFKEWLEYVAEELNDARIVLSVRQTNERAIKFYQKFGFEIVCDCKWNKEDGYVMVRG